MKAVVQRCFAGRVTVAGEIVGEISKGLVVFVGAGAGDSERDLSYLVDKIVGLRIFPDEQGKMSKSVLDVGGAILAVSQFTLFGDVRKGRRPSFDGAMPPGEALPFIERFVEAVRARGVQVETGRFGADMRVEVDNDGPVTILLDSRATSVAER
ncbi:MAG: D-aminoacyl-tRNA deacylase [Polyangiaceae bacterium]